MRPTVKVLLGRRCMGVSTGREPGTTDAGERVPGAELRALLRLEDRQQRHRRHDTHPAEER